MAEVTTMIALLIVGGVIGFLVTLPYAMRCRTFDKAPAVQYMFLAPWVEDWTFLLKSKSWQYLHNTPFAPVLHGFLKFWCRLNVFAALLSPHAYEDVDLVTFKGVRVKTRLVSAYSWHFQVPWWLGGKNWLPYVRWKMLRAVKAAKREGVEFLGLGAMTKDHQLTDDGQWYADVLGPDCPRLAHGDTLTAAALYHQVKQLLEGRKNRKVFLTGATSKIGRALAIRLARDKVVVYMHTESRQRFEQISREADQSEQLYLEFAPTLEKLLECDICITGKATGGKRLLDTCKQGTVFVNFSVPDPFTPGMLEGREVYHYDGALLDYSAVDNNLSFTMRLVLGKTYACHAWLLVSAAHGLNDQELGPVNVDRMGTYWQLAEELGVKLPKPTSFLHPKLLPDPDGKVHRHITPPPPTKRAA